MTRLALLIAALRSAQARPGQSRQRPSMHVSRPGFFHTAIQLHVTPFLDASHAANMYSLYVQGCRRQEQSSAFALLAPPEMCISHSSPNASYPTHAEACGEMLFALFVFV